MNYCPRGSWTAKSWLSMFLTKSLNRDRWSIRKKFVNMKSSRVLNNSERCWVKQHFPSLTIEGIVII